MKIIHILLFTIISIVMAEKNATPSDFGISDKQYYISEANLNFEKILKKVSINKFFHKRTMSNVKNQLLQRENQDLLYSSAVVDVSKGATFTLPEYPAYSTLQIVDMENYNIATIYPGESVYITPKDLNYGRYVYLNARTQPTSLDSEGLKNAHIQQNSLIIKTESNKSYTPPSLIVPNKKIKEIRDALIKDVQRGKIKDYTTIMGSKKFVNPQGHLYMSAYHWAGLPIEDAAYFNIPVKSNGDVCSFITINPPPVDYDRNGFWSITTYNEKGWLTENKASISNKEAIPNTDGTITIRFNCKKEENNINTVNKFTALLRIYVPTGLKKIEKYLTNAQNKYSITPKTSKSSNTSTKPIKVFSKNFIRAKTDYMFHKIITQTKGINKLYKLREFGMLDQQISMRMSKDSLYVYGIIDTKDGAWVEIPQMPDKRYSSVQIVDNDSYTPSVFYGGGKRTILAHTRYVMLCFRIQIFNPNDKKELTLVHDLQDQLIVHSNSKEPLPPFKWDKKSFNSLHKQYQKDSIKYSSWKNMEGPRGTTDEKIRHIAVTTAWGLLPQWDITYLNYNPKLDAKGCYKATYKVPKNRGFWSITVYNKEGYLANSNSILNSYNTKLDTNDTFTLYFGSQEVCGDVQNRLDITESWNFLFRIYRPKKEVLDGTYILPKVTKIK